MSASVSAQFYGDDKVHIYVKQGYNPQSCTDIYGVVFDGNRARISKIGSHVIRDCRTEENLKNQVIKNSNSVSMRNISYMYDSSFSTSSRTTYTWRNQIDNGEGYAFSKDKKSLVRFNIERGEVSDKWGKEEYYDEIDILEVLPKAANRDFLYE